MTDNQWETMKTFENFSFDNEDEMEQEKLVFTVYHNHHLCVYMSSWCGKCVTVGMWKLQ